MPKITIHTASFNRAHTLGRVYESLLSQTCKDFEWIISDDGSTDDTEKLVEGWCSQDNGFDIIYSKLTHVGFPRALNDGVRLANTEWIMKLDSDDWILPKTVETIIPWVEEIQDKKMMAGIGVTCCRPDGCLVKDQLPIIDPVLGYVDARNSERDRYNLNLDCFEVTRTEMLRKYPFQCWPTEEYAPPTINYNMMSLDGYMWRWRVATLYIADYQNDGLSKKIDKVKNNPMGYAMNYNLHLLRNPGFKARCYNAIQMIALCFYANNLSYLRQSNAKLITALVFPVGLIWGIRRMIQFSRSS